MSIEGISQYKKNHTYVETRQSTEAVKETASSSPSALQKLSAGKVFEGTITEIKNGQVTIGLPNGESISARMDSSVKLRPGEPMLFEVKTNNGSQISIRPVSVESALNPTLNDALKAAGLSVNERNIMMVNAMMKEQMPINKSSLLAMQKISMQFSDKDINLLVQMAKQNFVIDESSIKQFENYKGNTHMLLNQFQNFMNEIPNVMIGSNPTPKEVLSFQMQLLNIFNKPTVHEGTPFTIMPDPVKQITNEGRDVLNFNLNQEQDQLANQQANAEQKAMADMLRNLMEEKTTVTNETKEDAVIVSSRETQNLPMELLSPEEQAQLSAQLKEFRGLAEDPILFKNGTLNTELSPEELLNRIQLGLQNSEGYTSASLQKLLYGDEYQKLMKHVIEKQWMITPEEISGERKMEEFYEKLNRQLTDLDTLLKNTGKDTTTLSKSVENMRGNLEFMNQVNHMYNYIQIPLKLQNQNAHSDLYVYTNKKKLQDKEGELTALLHLDMENLGSTDIYIKLQKMDLSTTFYMDDKASFHLLLKNITSLEKKLEEKGYQCSVSVENHKKGQDFVEDFLKQEAPAGKVNRYSFDVKA